MNFRAPVGRAGIPLMLSAYAKSATVTQSSGFRLVSSLGVVKLLVIVERNPVT